MARLIDQLRSLVLDYRDEVGVLIPGCSDPVPLACLIRSYTESHQDSRPHQADVLPHYPVREVTEEISATLWRLARTED